MSDEVKNIIDDQNNNCTITPAIVTEDNQDNDRMTTTPAVTTKDGKNNDHKTLTPAEIINGRDITELSEDELDAIIDTLNDNEDPATSTLNNVLSNPSKENCELEEAQLNVSIDAYGNETVLADNAVPEGVDLSLSEIESGSLDDIQENQIKENVSNMYDLSDEDANTIISIILRYKNGEKFSIFNALPKPVQDQIRMTAVTSGVAINPQNLALFSKMMLDEFISDAKIDQAFVDFQKSLEKELDIPSIADFYSAHFREQMEDKLLEKADIFEKHGNLEKAEEIRRVSAAFTDSYTYKTVRKFLNTNRKARKRIKDTSKYNRFCDEFDFSAKRSNFTFRSMHLVGQTLEKAFPEFSVNDIKKLVIMICSAYRLKKHDDIADTALLYYTVVHITNLAFLDNKKTDFANIVINNIKELMADILAAEKEIEAENK